MGYHIPQCLVSVSQVLVPLLLITHVLANLVPGCMWVSSDRVCGGGGGAEERGYISRVLSYLRISIPGPSAIVTHNPGLGKFSPRLHVGLIWKVLYVCGGVLGGRGK